jgi:hypothetical protein
MKDSKILELFEDRDEAVLKKDRGMFLSTQVKEIQGSMSGGYMKLEKMESEVLGVVEAGTTGLVRVVAVREKYWQKSGESHEALLLYHLVESKEGWKVYKIVW